VSTNRILSIRRLGTGSVFRLAAIGFSCSLIPFALLMGVFALFGFHTVSWNQQPITGVEGLLASPFIGLFLAVLFTIFIGTFLSLGLWIYSKIRPLALQVFEDAKVDP